MHKFSKAAKAVIVAASVTFAAGVINAQNGYQNSVAKIVQTNGEQLYAIKRVAGDTDTLRSNFNRATALAKKTVDDLAPVKNVRADKSQSAVIPSSVTNQTSSATVSTTVPTKTPAKKVSSGTMPSQSSQSSTTKSGAVTAVTAQSPQTSTTKSATATTAPAQSSQTGVANSDAKTATSPKQKGDFSGSKKASDTDASSQKPFTKTQKKTTEEQPSTQSKQQQAAASQIHTSSNFSQVSTYWRSSGQQDKKVQSNYKMRIYSEPDKKGKVVANVGIAENFTVEQGDWVRVKTSTGQVGWALVRDVETNINEAWNGEYQVIINGPSSNYSVSKVSPEERVKRQQAMRRRQMERMQKLSRLWEQDFFDFDASDEVNPSNEIQELKKQVLALNSQLKSVKAGS